MENGNKIKFGLKNVHYAVMKDDGTYETPKHIPGAVSLSLDPEGDINPFYADDSVYYQTSSNNGYSGDLEMALIPDEFRVDVLGETLVGGLLVENIDAKQNPFALAFEVQGDKNKTKFWYYNCTVTRPKSEAGTREDKTEPQTDTLTLSAVADANGNTRTKSTKDTSQNVLDTWYDSVVMPSPVLKSTTNTSTTSK